MYTWRCFLAIIFVLVWYFSEYGQIWTQAFFCFLCFLNFPFKKQDRETSTQTIDTIEETARQTQKGHSVGASDETDAVRPGQIVPQTTEYQNVLRSLIQVFKCAYIHLVQPWYTVPEVGDSQPLHRALHTEFKLVVEKAICKAKNFDLSATSVGCIKILTQHLHNAKQSDGYPAFRSRSEEMAVLRTFSGALVRNLFPEYLWEPKLYQCVLTEIVAIKALDVLVAYLCDPDSLNQMVVLQLDRVTHKSSVGDLLNSDRASTPSSVGSEEVFTGDPEDSPSEDTKGKKKGNKFKEGISKLYLKVKSKTKKKRKKKDQALPQRACYPRRSAVIEGDDASITDSSMGSALDSDNDNERDVYLTSVQEDMVEFKLSYQMWRVGKWAVHVTKVEKESEELCFTIHLEEKNNPENLHWDVKKTQSDILHFHSLWQVREEMDTSMLPSISTIVEKTQKELDDTYAKEVRSALEHYLQELVSDAHLGNTQPVFQFLCPIARLLNDTENDGGVWSFLNGLASFLSPSQDEEESHKNKSQDKLDQAGASVHHSGPIAQPACIDTAEEPKGSGGDGPTATNLRISTSREEVDPFRGKGPDVGDIDQISDDMDKDSEGHESLAESLDIFLHRSKLIVPTAHPNDVPSSGVSHSEGVQVESDGLRSAESGGKINKKEKLTQKKSNGLHKLKVKEKMEPTKEETTNQPQKKELQSNWEQVEATKAVFDLLKEITGNSVLINIVDAILKPVQPLVKKKINGFLKKMHPTEAQLASYIDKLRENIWPDGNVPLNPPREAEVKNETKEKALQLISKYSNSLILKKTDVETLFKIFQDAEENKKLVYMLLKYILRKFLPGEQAFSSIANQTVKDFVS